MTVHNFCSLTAIRSTSPVPTVPTANRFGLIEPFITARYTAKNGNERTRSLRAPMPNVLTDNHFHLAERSDDTADAATSGFP
jgi:hypothetical protein